MQTAPELQDSFIFDAWDALGTFEAATAKLDGSFKPALVKELSVVTHRLKGTAALYHYPQISSLAELAERLLEQSSRLPAAETVRVRAFLEKVAVCLQDALTRIASGKSEGNLGLELSYLGGASLLQQLLKENRESFTRSDRKKTVSGPAQAQRSLSGTLKSFYTQHQDDWGFFAPEASEHLEIIADTLQTVRQQGADTELLTALFRSTHTLKGAAYMVGLTPMGDLAHLLEDLMVEVREGDLPFGDEAQRALSGGAEALALMLPAAEGKATEVEKLTLEARRRLHTHLGLEPDPEPGVATDPAPAPTPTTDTAAPDAFVPDIDPGVLLRAFRGANPEVWSYFPDEARDHVRVIRESCAAADLGSVSDRLVSTIFRAAHTLKGATAAVGYPYLPEHALKLERLMIEVREQELPFDAAVLDVLRTGADVVEALLVGEAGQELGATLTAFDALYTPLVSAPEPVTSTEGADAAQTKALTPGGSGAVGATIRVSLAKLDTLMTLSNELVSARARVDGLLGQLGDLSSVLDTSRTRLSKTVDEFEERYLNPRLQASLPLAAGNRNPSGAADGGLRLGLSERFDELEFDSYSDLDILARSVAEMSSDLGEVQAQFNRLGTELREETQEVASLTASLRSEVGRARMVAVRQLFGRLRRLVTEVPDKSYTFSVSGENVEVDNLILEGVADPLLHLVKNAVVHGVETESVRLAAGKPATGTVSVSARQQGNRVVIDVADDGGGIDVEAVKSKAVERGLLTAEAAAEMTTDAALKLIFLPGLSTAAEVTTDAGRGVGMEAVATNIERLKGEVTIHSELGRGTRFTLSLPLTLIVTEALMVEVAEQRLALPADAVRSLHDVLKTAVVYGETHAGSAYLVLNGEQLPYYHLGELLGYAPDDGEAVQVALIETGGSKMALGVDTLLELEEVVVRGLEAPLKALTHLAGAAVSSSGEVVLMLDPAGIRALSGVNPAEWRGAAVSPQAPAKAAHVLLVDDSISVRKVVAKMLVRSGYQVSTAADGLEALERLREDVTFDALVTDLEMPRMSGFELIEEVRRKAEFADLPIVVVTTRAGEKHTQLAFELGASDYLTKPVDETKLLRFLERAVQVELPGGTRGQA